MDLSKKKYTNKEVLDILNAYKGEYEKRFAEQREIIYRLNEELKTLKAETESIRGKESIISATLIRAEQTAQDLKDKAELQYMLEVERLKKFVSRWEKYFEELKERYPHYQPVKKAIEFVGKIERVSEDEDPKEVVSRLDGAIPKSVANEKFDPKSKIKDYIAATGNNGFNLDEVLNPGKIELEDICKELGLMDGNE